MRGRPLRFLAVVLLGWTTVRVVLLWPEGDGPGPIPKRLTPPAAAAATQPTIEAAYWLEPKRSFEQPVVAAQPIMAGAKRAKPEVKLSPTRHPPRRGDTFASVPAASASVRPPPPGLPPTIAPSPRKRWSVSAWAIARDGSGGSLLSPLLGGSQAGVRVAYALDRNNRIAAFARFATPLKGGPAELALGGQWRPGPTPVTLYAEARASDGRVVPAAGMFGGGVVEAIAGFRLEGYGQAGLIARDGVSGFGDAQVRLVKPLGRIEAGTGLWGAAQRGAARLDIGPSVALPIPAEPLVLRLTVDWRHRIAGNARPASGPVISLGVDF